MEDKKENKKIKGQELEPDQLEKISGGNFGWVLTAECPYCGMQCASLDAVMYHVRDEHPDL